ncbi:MAG: choice-of-anchor J domain-containing protein, partial [Candidatus Thermoplasmatota archaeon]
MRNKMACVLSFLMLLSFMCIEGDKDELTPRQVFLFTDNTEGGGNNWSHGGAEDEWELGKPTSGPGYSHSGSYCWGTDLDDNYNDDANAWLSSYDINLKNNFTSCALIFWHWYNIYKFVTEDHGYVEITKDNGKTWEKLASYTGDAASEDWHEIKLNISSYIGNIIKIRFRLVSDDAFNATGWYIDDISVIGELKKTKKD